MTKNELYNKVIGMLPVTHPKGSDFEGVLRDSLDKYVSYVQQLNEKEVSDKSLVMKSLEMTNKRLLSAVDNINKGMHHAAFSDIRAVLKGRNLCVHTLSSGQIFYRMRSNEKKESFDREDLFHIPYNKRGLVKTQRYSMPGYPCLYLGYSLIACWEEMHRPSLDNIMFSAFMLTHDAEFLSLTIPSTELWVANIENYINVIPLIIACMIHVDDYSNPYKIEYTIPQLITEWFIVHRSNSHHNMLGLEYTSVHINKDFDFPQTIYNNLALPVRDFTTLDFCSTLKKAFVLTKPTSEEIERIKKGSRLSAYSDEGESDVLQDNYRHSLFGELEESINSYAFEPLL